MSQPLMKRLRMIPLVALPERRLRCAPPLEPTEGAFNGSSDMQNRESSFATIAVRSDSDSAYTFSTGPEGVIVTPKDLSKRIYCGCGSVVTRVLMNKEGKDVKFGFYVGGYQWYPYRLNSVVTAVTSAPVAQEFELFYMDGSDFQSRDVKPGNFLADLVEAGCAFVAKTLG